MQDMTRQLGLPRLEIVPSNFKGRVEVSLSGEHRVMATDIKTALDKMDLWLFGYSACYTNEPRTDRDGTVFEDQCDMVENYCNEILASGGKGGPNDHVVLVQALLALRKEIRDGNL